MEGKQNTGNANISLHMSFFFLKYLTLLSHHGLFIYFFNFGCAGSLLQRTGFL